MKIEKLNDNQIRCTLTREDLASHEINLLELAYGSDKAKSLFREMMQQAAFEFGFEANDIPIMIEAIPISSDSIILIITKVEDPEELDTRFSKFAPDVDKNSDGAPSFSSLKLEGADDILNLLKKIKEVHKTAAQKSTANTPPKTAPSEDAAPADVTRLYYFGTLDDVITTAGILGGSYQGRNSLYKHPENGMYCLLLNSAGCTPEEFNRICNTISEYAGHGKLTVGTEAFLAEHGTCIVPENALQKLAEIVF